MRFLTISMFPACMTIMLPVIFRSLVADSIDSGVNITPPTSARKWIINNPHPQDGSSYALTDGPIPNQNLRILKMFGPYSQPLFEGPCLGFIGSVDDEVVKSRSSFCGGHG